MAGELKWFAYNYRIPERTLIPGELLFEFVRGSDQLASQPVARPSVAPIEILAGAPTGSTNVDRRTNG
jgi:hypothetical protein